MCGCHDRLWQGPVGLEQLSRRLDSGARRDHVIHDDRLAPLDVMTSSSARTLVRPAPAAARMSAANRAPIAWPGRLGSIIANATSTLSEFIGFRLCR